jgi:sigma-B regulation protein RsbU (phosphoserine phosphatase)
MSTASTDFSLLPLATLGIGVLTLAACWAATHRRSQNLLSLTGLSQRVSQLADDPAAVYAAVEQKLRTLTDASDLILQLARVSQPGEPVLLVNGQAILAADERATLGEGAYRWMAEHRSQLLVPDTALVSPVTPLKTDRAAISVVYTPLVAEGRLYGVLTLQSIKKNAFRRRACNSLQVLADQIALGLHNARQGRQEQEYGAQLRMIAEVSRRVTAILDLDALFADTVRLVRETFGYYHVCLFSVDATTREIMLQSSSSPLIQQRGLIVPWGHGLIGHAALGETVLANDVRRDSRFLRDTALEATAAELSLPLMVEDRVLGVLDVQRAEADSFSDGDISTLRILGDQIAVAIEDSHLYRAQQEQAWISTALLRVAEAVAEQSSLSDITGTVERLARMLTGISHCAVLVWQQEDGVFLIPQWATSDAAATGDLVLTPEAVPLAERARVLGSTQEGRSVDLGGLWTQATAPEMPVICLPLVTKGEAMGVLAAALDPVNTLPPAQRTVLEGVARQAALGIDNARLLISQREEAWVSTALLQVATVISSASYDLDETVNAIVRLIPMLVGVSWCALLVWDPEARQYQAASSYGLQVEAQNEAARRVVSPDDYPWLGDIQHGQGVSAVEEPLMRDLRLAPAGAPRAGILAMPLKAHFLDLGILFVGIQPPAPGITGRRMAILNGIAGQTALALSASRLYQQSVRHQSLENEMRLAREIQAGFLPEHCPAYPGWDIAVDWRAARGVGGDYYDFIEFGDGRLGVSIADVSDKGIAAALYMALSRTVLRAASLDTRGPVETLQRANQVLMQESRSGMFVSIVYAIIELDTGTVRYVRAGHNPALHVRSGGEIALLNPDGIALGIMPDPDLAEEVFTLMPGDMLVLYTDGVTEAWNGVDDEFGMERLLQATSAGARTSPAELIEGVNSAVHAFVGGSAQSDDYTILVVKRE